MKFHKMMHPFLFKILIISAGTSGKEGPARPSTAKSGRRRLSQPLPPKGTGGPPPLRPADGPPCGPSAQNPAPGAPAGAPAPGGRPGRPGIVYRPDPACRRVQIRKQREQPTGQRPLRPPAPAAADEERPAFRRQQGHALRLPQQGLLPREQPHPAGLVPLAPAAGMAANLPAVGGKGRPVLQQVPGLFHRTAHSQTDTSMEEIITSSTGMSFRPVFTAAMASTTTMPSYTWPNTV